MHHSRVSDADSIAPAASVFSQSQSRSMSLIEAVANVAVGFVVAVLTQIAVYCGIPAGVDCFRHARPVIAEWQKNNPK